MDDVMLSSRVPEYKQKISNASNAQGKNKKPILK